MTMYLFYILITLLVVALFFLVKDKKELTSKLGIIGITSSISLIVIGLILKLLFNTFLNKFNITKISSLIFNKFLHISLFLLVIGLIMFIISKLLNRNNKKSLPNT